MKTRQFYNKNQFLIESEEKIVFQSYDSVIAIIDKTKNENSLTLGIDWDCSNTTRKHLYLFLKDYYYLTVYSKIENSNNKREAIQELINNGFINYDENLV